jgi:hypothetical protein
LNAFSVVAKAPGNCADALPVVPTTDNFPNIHDADLVIGHVLFSSLLMNW